MAMIHPKRLVQLVRKWQKVKIKATSPITDKGHCAMCTADGRRFQVPLTYLDTTVFSELLRMSQEEFGFTRDGRTTLPFDAVVMESVMCMLRRNASEEVEDVPELCCDALPISKLYSATCNAAPAACSL